MTKEPLANEMHKTLNALCVSFRAAQRLTLDSLALNKMLEEGGSLDDIQI